MNKPTTVTITVTLSNPGGSNDSADQTFELSKRLPDEQLSPSADKALRAAASSLGVKLPKGS